MSSGNDSSPWNRPLRAVTFDATHTLFHSPRLVSIYLEVLRRHYGFQGGFQGGSQGGVQGRKGQQQQGHGIRAADLGRLLPMVWEEFSCSTTPPADRFTHPRFAGHAEGSKGFWSRYAERLCEYLGLDASPFAAAELFDRFGRAEAWEVYPDVEETLVELKRRGLALGVISNWDERLPGLLDEMGLARHFDTIVYSAECGVEKPHASIFRICLDRLGVSADEALHVGDSELEDVEGARAVGLKALRIDRRSGVRVRLLDLLRPMLQPLRSGPPNLLLLDSKGSRG